MRRIGVVTTLLALAACSTLGKAAFREPSVSLRDVRVMGLGITGGELEVWLNVYNPNEYRLDANKLTYRVFVSDSVPVANGMLDNRSTVQGGDSTIVKIPVSFTYAGLGSAGRQLMQTGVVTYKVTGEVTVGAVTGNFTVPFSTTGRYSTVRR